MTFLVKNSSQFLIQSYLVTSDDFENSEWIVWTTFL